MKIRLTYIKRATFLLLLSTLNPQLLTAHAQGTAFTYQGRLNNNGATASGWYDFQFALFDAATGGFQIGGTLTTNAVAVSNGLFTVTLDFGAGVFTGANRWLNLAVKTNGAVSFTPLTPLQQITATPYAITAGTVTGVIPTAALSGLYTGPVTMNNPGNVFNGALFAGVFTGNGSGLTGVNATTLGGLSSAGFWKTNGNTGANPTNGAFIGTADNLPVEFKVNGSRALRLEPTTTPGVVNVIGGWALNSVAPGVAGATIAGGGLPVFPNTIAASYAAIGGGTFNTASGGWSTIGGGRDNTVTSIHSTVSGGRLNLIQTNADAATISGGNQNLIQTNASFATVGGGKFNQAAVNEATVAGGAFNSALAFSSTVGGGGGNAASGEWSTIAGGRDNLLTNADYAVIGGGSANAIRTNSSWAIIGGGQNNVIGTAWAVIAGGYYNTNNGLAAFIGAGDYNAIGLGGTYAFVGAGYNNNTQGDASVVGGGYQNTIQSNSAYAVIGGGNNNNILTNSVNGSIGGGGANTVGAPEGTVAGGAFNSALAFSSTVGGGGGNRTSGEWSTIAGGRENLLTNASYATIGGGLQNTIQTNSDYATIGGGGGNTIQTSGHFATIPGGRYNSATNYAFAAGNRAKANHTGGFVWADSTDVDFASTAANQFLVRAGGGMGINKNNPATALDVSGTVTATGFSGSGAGLTGLSAASLTGSVPSASLTSVPAGSLTGAISDARLSANVALLNAAQTFTAQNIFNSLIVNTTARVNGANNWGVSGGEGDFRVGNDSYRFKIGVANAGGGAGDVWMRAHGGIERINLKAPGGTRILSNEAETAGVSLAAGGTAWAVISDRNVKKDFAAVDSVQILEKLAALPITQWHYTWENADITPHIGPMAQDFKAAFYPGTDEKSITTQEADGVALAAIQGLNQKLLQQEAALKNKEFEIRELRQALAELQQTVYKMARQTKE